MELSHPIVAFQGEHGAYSEQAARQQFGPDARPLPCRTFAAITDALQAGHAHYGMLPVENSLAGTVVPAYDLLVDYDLHVQAEVILRVEHCLMAPPGVALADVRRVRSHPQALMQCETALRRLGLEPVSYTHLTLPTSDLV